MRDLIEEIATGSRTITGTDWPIVDQLHRTGEREWTVTRDLCNGIPRAAETYRSEAAARDALGHRLDGRKPRAGAAADERITIRYTSAELAAIDEVAARKGVTRSEWIREAALTAVARGSSR